MSVSVIDILSAKTKKDADIITVNCLLADVSVVKKLVCDDMGNYSLEFQDNKENKSCKFSLLNSEFNKKNIVKNESNEPKNSKIQNQIQKKQKKTENKAINRLTKEQMLERKSSIEKTENEFSDLSEEKAEPITEDMKQNGKSGKNIFSSEENSKKINVSVEKQTKDNLAETNTKTTEKDISKENVENFFELDIPDGLSPEETEKRRSCIKSFLGKEVLYTRHYVSIDDLEEEYGKEKFNIFTYLMSDLTTDDLHNQIDYINFDIVSLIVKDNQIIQVLYGKCRENLTIRMNDYEWTLLASLQKDENGLSFVTTLKLAEDFTDRDRFESKDSLRVYGMLNTGYNHPYINGYHVLPVTKAGDKNTMYAVIKGNEHTWANNAIAKLGNTQIGLMSKNDKYIVRVN